MRREKALVIAACVASLIPFPGLGYLVLRKWGRFLALWGLGALVGGTIVKELLGPQAWNIYAALLGFGAIVDTWRLARARWREIQEGDSRDS